MAEPRAIIDIGTNTVLMLVASRSPSGLPRVIRDEAIITRLGRGADATGRLAPAAIDETLEALRAHRDRARADGVASIRAIATESLRMASNREAFLVPAAEVLGTDVEMISGQEEARLSYFSVAREERKPGPMRVIDIGGGSTEIVAGEGQTVLSTRSHRVGSVRLTERLATQDPPGAEIVAAMDAVARAAFETQPLDPFPLLHGLAGTVTTAAALLLGLQRYDRARVDGSRFERARVIELRDALAVEPLERRAERPCLPTRRADVIVAGLTILVAAMDHCGAHTLVARDRGVRYALI